MSTPRWKAQIAVAFLSRSQSHVLLTESVSARGVFVRTDAPPPPMTLLRVQFLLPPEDARLVLHGMITNTVQPQSAHGVPGVEVLFFASSADAIARWDAFLQHLRDSHPESSERPVMLARDVGEPIDRYAFVEDFNAIDASPGGMFVTTRQRFVVGTDVRVTLVDPRTREQRAVDCVVRRRTTGGEAGIGVEYRNMTSAGWSDLAAFLHPPEGKRALRADLHVVREPYVPATMQTLSGPWSDDAVPTSRASRDDSWSLPPESGWSDARESH